MAETDVPPPSAALLARVASMAPVRPRRPLVEWALVAAVSLGAVAALMALFGLRQDRAPVAMGLGVAGAAVAFAAELWWALVPPRAQVLPLRRGAGGRVALVWLGVVALFVAGGRAAADPHFVRSAEACLALGCFVATVPALACLLALRHAVAVGGWRLGVVVGAAAGALGGVLLELHCGNTHAAHLIVAHGGALAIPALVVGALASRRS